MVKGKIVDIHNREIFNGSVEIENGVIIRIKRLDTEEKGFIIPGFIDAHVHIESSMLTPTEFGRLVIRHGTVAVVTDPHEIANVMGKEGVRFMKENSKSAPINTFFTIPSCVPATPFDVSGGTITAADIEQLVSDNTFVALSEMMNIPGVLSEDKEVMAKLCAAKKHKLPIDGHAPTLIGEPLKQYIAKGISTDHESVTMEEAMEKINLGMKIHIREGSAARNYEALKSLIRTNPNDIMFCTDDSHPDEIIAHGHIDKIVKKAIADGFDLFNVLKIASLNPIEQYALPVGQLRIGDRADFIKVDSLESFCTEQVYIRGVKQYDKEIHTSSAYPSSKPIYINNFKHDKIQASELRKSISNTVKGISLMDGELITSIMEYTPDSPKENFESDINNDILKIVYINRYNNGTPQIAFCKGFNLKQGAFASSIAHDSHNILAVGCTDENLAEAINAVIRKKGGLSVHKEDETHLLPLPIGGIMSGLTGEQVAAQYKKLNNLLHEMGCTLSSPFMTLSFMALVVIPEIKIGEKGLFSFNRFNWIEE